MNNQNRSQVNGITEVTKSEPCKHCGKPDWCYRIGDLEVCKRGVEPGDGWEKTTKADKEGAVYYAVKQIKKAPRTEQKREFPYYDSQGNKIVKVDRIDKIGVKKKMWQSHWDTANKRWIKEVPPEISEQVCIYRQEQVAKNIERGRTIFLVDGEACADALCAIGLQGTTFLGGAGKWREAYKAALIDADLVLCPDRDKTGIEQMEKLAKEFPSARWLYAPPSDFAWNHLPPSDGLDLFDWILDGAKAEDIKGAIGAKKYGSLPPTEGDRPGSEPIDFSLPEAEEIFTQKAQDAIFGDTKWISLNGHLYKWGGTHYELMPDAAIKAKIAHWCASTPVQHKDRRQYDYAKSSYVENIWNWVHLAFAVDPALVNPPGINCINGTVRLHWQGKKVSWKLEPHSLDELYIYTNQINYDSKADRTQCDRLLACLEPDQQDILLKTLAASLDLATVRKYRSRIKSIFNQGDGNNGKDSVREAASYLYGSSMTSATISDFQVYDGGKKFPLAKLENSLINWSSENASLKSIDGLQSLKAAITGEPLDVERKNQDERPMLLNTVFFFNINEAPNLQAGLEAIQSRWAVLSFNKTYKVGADISKGELEADSRFRYDPEFLQTEVVPALLNRVLEALPKLMEEGIDYSCTQKALESIQQQTNHLWAFASEVGLNYSTGGRVYINELWERLKDWYIANGTLEIHKTSDGKEKQEWHDPVSNRDKNVRGANQVHQRFAVLFPKITKRVEAQIRDKRGQSYLDGINFSEAVSEASEAVSEASVEATALSQSECEASEAVERTLLQILTSAQTLEPLELRRIMLKIKNTREIWQIASLASHPDTARAVASTTASTIASTTASTASQEEAQVIKADNSNFTKAIPLQSSTVNASSINSGDNTSNFFTPAPSCFKVGDFCQLKGQCYGVPKNKRLQIVRIDGGTATVTFQGCRSHSGVEVELDLLEPIEQENQKHTKDK